jgi:electron transfer flavoprotein alpha subunit
MEKVLCYIAVQDGKVKRSSLEVLSRFREISVAHDFGLEAVLLGPDADDHVATVAAYGPGKILTVKDVLLVRHSNQLFVEAFVRAMNVSGADTLVMASNEGAKDVLGAVGVRLSASVLPDVSSVDVVDGAWEVTRPVMAAKRLARTRALTTPSIISVRSGAYSASESAADAEVVDVPLEVSEDSLRMTIREVLGTVTGEIDLSEAGVVVAAGRGVKDEEGTRLVRELASVLGGAVGATRAVVESNLFPATAQIGQTGKVVSPELYFAVGISGAIQHVAGMSNSRVIVAINKDAEAPIFRYSSYGVVGDLYKILPILIDQLRTVQTR